MLSNSCYRSQHLNPPCAIYRTHHFSTLAKLSPFTLPPPIASLTLRLNPSLFAFKSSAASLFRGSEAFGSRKRNYHIPRSVHTLIKPHHTTSIKHTCKPTMTAFKFNTGFQSSLKIFKQTFPSRSIFGW